MARVEARVTVDVRQLPAVKLLIVRLTQLHDEMRVMASPHADELGAILARVEHGLDAGGEDDD